VGLLNGRTLLATGDQWGQVQLWDPATGTQASQPLTGHHGPVWSLATVGLPNGRTVLATGHENGQVLLWDPATGTQASQPQTGHHGPVWSLATVGLPNGRTVLATGHENGQVQLWDPATDTTVTKLTAPPRVLSLAAVGLPDGHTLLATGHENGQVQLWDPATGTQASQPLTGHHGPVLSLATVRLPDGPILLASGDASGQVRLWLLTVGRSRLTAPALQVGSGMPASDTPSRQRRGLFGARKALGVRDTPADPPAAKPPRTLPVPEVEATLVATLIGSRGGAWAALLPDGRSYKADGDVSDVLWWVIKLCRFESGELDPYDQTIRRLPHSQPILGPLPTDPTRRHSNGLRRGAAS
jgi:hypothetical protein